MDDLTAQKILHDWAIGRGWSTTLMNNRLYFHSDKYQEFAFVDFAKIPKITLHVSDDPTVKLSRDWTWSEDFNLVRPSKPFTDYELNLAEEKVFIQIERILSRTIDSYIEG